MIELKNVFKSFEDGKIVAVQDASLSLQPAQTAVLIGVSGSGKSTLLRIMAGLDLPSSGEVTVNGEAIATLSEAERTLFRLRNIGLVFQEHHLIPELSAIENVMLPMVARGDSWRDAEDEASELLSKLGLADLKTRRPLEMSGGQRQRVGIARAFGGGRQILLADEPTGALDSSNSKALFEWIQTLSGLGATVLIATHDPLAMAIADQVYTMSDGRPVPAEQDQ